MYSRGGSPVKLMSCILLVDDDPQFRRTLHLALSSHNHEVIEAADGREALELMASSTPDVVVLDWHLPKLSGIDTCRAVRAGSDVPIIMISANRANSKTAAVEAGANDYLAKPFSLNALLTHIESTLKHS